MTPDPFEELIKDPDKRAKAYVYMTIAFIISTFMIAIGTIIFILHVIGII
ncbi:hypothetical protein [Methanobacterium aggregans]|nr:hypothetical protein [Methanobacterium aggregans]MBP2046208.1 hypothetical protein [Methanobacterium aggregans]